MSLTSDTSKFELRDSYAENKPRLLHSRSKQSVAASEDYYSLSDRASNAGDEQALHIPSSTDRRRFSTPPSRIHSPDDAAHDDTHTPAHQQRHSVADERHFRRKAVGSTGPKELAPLASEQKSLAREKGIHSGGGDEEAKKMDPTSRTYTPGQDDSQFIRFAIDQLTRDEEIRGSRRYAVNEEEGGDSSTSSEALAQPMHPYQQWPASLPPAVVAAEAAEASRRPQTPLGIRVVPHEEEELREGRLRQPRPIPDDIMAMPQTPEPIRRERLAQQKEMQAGPAPAHPLAGRAPTASSSSIHPDPESDVFVSYNPIKPTTQQPRLDFVPAILRPMWLIIFLALCVLMLTGLLFCAAWCLTHDGMWDYISFGDARYFVFEYLPTILGMIILVWLLQIEIALIRIAPFMAMTSSSTKSRSASQFLNLYPTQFLLPKIEYFRSGQTLLGVCFVIFWLFLFTVPLLGASFNVGFFGPREDGVWRWVAVQGVIWTVIVLYLLLIVALLLLLITLRRSETGLKWDPRSLADLIAMLERSNFLNEYTGTEIYTHLGDFRQRLWNSTPRIGYWTTSHRPNDIFYGLGEEGGLTRRYSVEAGRIREKGHRYHPSIDSQRSHEDLELGDQSRVQLNYRHSVVRRRFIPWFLSSSAVLAWILLAFVLLIAFYIVAFVNQATTGSGFLPQIRADTNSAGFSPANFLYSFVPGFIGFLIYLLWLPLDLAHRRLEPYRGMTSPTGALAEHSLLLDYPFRHPFSITLAALVNGHYKTALLSLISLLNTAIPVLSGGIFWAQWYAGSTQVRISAEPSGLYALCVFLALYAVALLAVVPGRKPMRMPHESKCLAEVVSWLYQSPILLDRAFTRCETKTELQTRLLGERAAALPTGLWASVTHLVHSFSREGLNKPENQKAKAVLGGPSPTGEADKRMSALSTAGAERAMYAFGVYTGRDGRDHLGVDKVGRGMVLFDD